MSCILGIGMVSSTGCGVDSLRAALDGSTSPHVVHASVPSVSPECKLAVHKPTLEGLERFIPSRALRRTDNLTRMALLSSFLAVENSGLTLEDKSRVGIAFGTAYGPLQTTFHYQDTIIDEGDQGASPTLFANSVHGAPASTVSILMQITGPSVTLTTFERTTAEVLRTAELWLAEGRVDYVLAGMGDEYCPVLGYAIHRLSTGPSSTIDARCVDRRPCSPGEGFVVFLLGNPTAGGRYGRIREITCVDCPSQLDAGNLASHRAVFLCAHGGSGCARTYRKADLASAAVACYSPLYGSMPLGLAFDLAVAGVSLHDGRLYPTRESRIDLPCRLLVGGGELSDTDSIACLECSPTSTTLISLRGSAPSTDC
ncbi:MAG: beta-ketoacyl synthase N-terminal-like domain-containing protein [Phycisphaerae bacterium]